MCNRMSNTTESVSPRTAYRNFVLQAHLSVCRNISAFKGQYSDFFIIMIIKFIISSLLLFFLEIICLLKSKK